MESIAHIRLRRRGAKSMSSRNVISRFSGLQRQRTFLCLFNKFMEVCTMEIHDGTCSCAPSCRPPTIRSPAVMESRVCQFRCWGRPSSRTAWSPSPGLKLACRSVSVSCAPSSRLWLACRYRGFREWWCYCGSLIGWIPPFRLSTTTEKFYVSRQEERWFEAR